jgi:hypothetical protein
MRSLQNRRAVPWGTKFDAAIREVWAMMEEYVWVRHGKDCTNLRSVISGLRDERVSVIAVVKHFSISVDSEDIYHMKTTKFVPRYVRKCCLSFRWSSEDFFISFFLNGISCTFLYLLY